MIPIRYSHVLQDRLCTCSWLNQAINCHSSLRNVWHHEYNGLSHSSRCLKTTAFLSLHNNANTGSLVLKIYFHHRARNRFFNTSTNPYWFLTQAHLKNTRWSQISNLSPPKQTLHLCTASKSAFQICIFPYYM